MYKGFKKSKKIQDSINDLHVIFEQVVFLHILTSTSKGYFCMF
jgi:hypothetical protein